MMTILIVGATGATGRLLVEQLLDRGHRVKAVVRSIERIPDTIRDHANLSFIEASVLNLSDAEIAQHVDGCEALACCLGHTMSFRGVFGPPRRLVTEATRRLCQAAAACASEQPVKFVLMNTTANSNRDLSEPVSFAHKSVVGILRLLVPPQADNEEAADYLREEIGQDNKHIEWSAVRPDALTDESSVTEYAVYPSPIRPAIFDPGKTSRINTAHFMAELITDDELWTTWRGKMPVIYNEGG